MDISELLKIWRVEKSASQLSSMPEEFYLEIRSLMGGKDPYSAKKAKDMFDDIVHMRQHKILMACLRGVQGSEKPENLVGSEKDAYARILKELHYMKTGDMNIAKEDVIAVPKDEEQETLAEAEEITEAEEEVSAPETEEVESKEEESKGEESKEIEEEIEPEVAPALDPDKDKCEFDMNMENPEDSKLVGCKPESVEETKETPKEEIPDEKSEEEVAEKREVVFKGETENKPLKRVRFLKPMPAFVGPDLQSLGPFDEGREVDLDDEIAEILIKNDAVELL